MTDTVTLYNGRLVSIARQKGVINKWEHDFYFSILEFKELSEKQAAIIFDINEKIEDNFAVKKGLRIVKDGRGEDGYKIAK